MLSLNKKKVKRINKNWIKAMRKRRRRFLDGSDISEIGISSSINFLVHFIGKLIALVRITEFDDNLGGPIGFVYLKAVCSEVWVRVLLQKVDYLIFAHACGPKDDLYKRASSAHCALMVRSCAGITLMVSFHPLNVLPSFTASSG